MIIYLFAIFIILFFGIVFKPNKRSQNKKIYCIIVGIVLFLIMALRKYTIGIDLEKVYYPNYVKFNNVSIDELKNIVWGGNWEFGFCLFLNILNKINPDPQFFIVSSSFIICFAYSFFIYKKSQDVIMSFLIFITSLMFYMSMNVVRQFLAASIILFGILFLEKKRYILATCLFLLSSQFHSSAIVSLVFLVFYFFKKKRINMVICVMLFLVPFFSRYIISFAFNIHIFEKYAWYLESEHFQGYFTINSIYGFVLPLSIFVFLSLSRYRQKDNFVYNILVLDIMFRLFSFFINVVSRISIYFDFAILLGLPMAINSFKYETNKTLKTLYAGGTIFAFLIITVLRAGMLFGTYPYEFFWS